MIFRKSMTTRDLILFALGPEVIMDSSFPEGTGNVWLDNVGCTGTEEELVDCPFNTVGSNNCGHSEDASMRCGMLKLVY